ncbi:MAG TPA: endopeptidase La [Vicinamibacterales bacterium]|jgi:ATP-dependent Lon protease|nr:endopeptidase La [Vicinamibacterales bacterium]
MAEPTPPTLPSELPVLPLRRTVAFPLTLQPLAVNRPVSIESVNRALGSDRMVLLLLQHSEADDPGPEDVHRVGTVGIVRQMAKAGGGINIIIEGIARVRADVVTRTGTSMRARITPMTETAERTIEVEAHVRRVQDLIEKALSLATGLSEELRGVVMNIDDPLRLVYILATLIDIKPEEKQALLEENSLLRKLTSIEGALSREISLLEMKTKIESQAQQEMTDAQRQYYLRQQMKAIQQELGEGEGTEMQELRKRIEDAKLPESVHDVAMREVDRLGRMGNASPEYQMLRTYVDWLLDIPWSVTTADRLDPVEARRVLDEDHYDLDKVKERIVEYLAVRKLKGDMKGPILCFVGPPGVGKTSLGQSIARAMDRKFVRISLGGVRDEAEIRGHRRTYIGSIPGRIVQALKQAGSMNPVFMLDEIDKVSAGGFQGDPSAALLEVLDPAQNHSFRDHYLEIPVDLSRVLFIATSNQLGTIHPALLDRMEIISLAGYTEEEKLHIARRYLLPRQENENGVPSGALEITDGALRTVVSEYTREAGVRNLERQLGTIARKVAAKIATRPPDVGPATKTVIDRDQIDDYLGPARFKKEVAFRTSRAGVATGVAWTETGGDVLFIEATLLPGGNQNIILTGQLGNVMQESARAALSHIRSRAEELGISGDFLAKHDLHIHVPAGAIPKDGPSAGVTMATAILSAARNQPVRKDVAMTGEITLSGLVLPVGGIREKALAARRFGIKTFVLPALNEPDLAELPEEVRRDMTFVPAETLEQVLKVAFEDALVNSSAVTK